MAYAFEVLVLLAGLASLVVGYRRNRRNVMLVAALLMFASVAGPQFAKGFNDGFMAQVPQSQG